MALYFHLLGAGLRARLQYKLDFIVSTIMYGLLTAGDFLTAAALLYRYHVIAGWNLYEVAMLAGATSAAFGLFRTFGSELYAFESYLVSGEFDSLLVRPWPPLALLLTRNFDLGRVGAVAQGYLVLLVGVRGVLAQGAPAWLVVYACLLPLAGACIVMAIALLTATAGFWVTRIDELQIFALNAPMTAANFPADIFPLWLRRLFTTFLPVLTWGYVPLTYALGKGGAPFYLAVPFVTAPLALLVGLRCWAFGVRHYQSTGN
ncbi:MAG TPA: ABC-2 family transporter protein [Symbiobacteriaceae bacterium]|jgi:ABC-2 type transport system permease protein